MKIAIPFDCGEVFAHFGHTQYFKIYTVNEQNKVTEAEIVEPDGGGHDALAGFLKSCGVNVLICGGIGGGAIAALREAGIRVCAGVSGDCDDVMIDYLYGYLEYTENPNCDHHHEGGEHHCGEGCGHCGGGCHN